MNAPEPRPRSPWSKLTDPEMLVAISAVIVGACALIVSLVQVQIMRAEQHTAVWPRLRMEQHYAAGRFLSLILVNRGLGPAVIQDVQVTIDDRPQTSWAAVVETLVPDRAPRDRALTAINGRILSAGETVTAFSTADPAFADTLAHEMERLSVAVCFCSVYD